MKEVCTLRLQITYCSFTPRSNLFGCLTGLQLPINSFSESTPEWLFSRLFIPNDKPF